MVTDAPLAATPRKSDEPYANCLFYTSGKCKKCAARCPADAISEQGHDKLKCYAHLKPVTSDYVKSEFGFDGYGCGFEGAGEKQLN